MTDISLRIILTAQDNTKAGMAALKNMNQYMSNIAPAAAAAGVALMAVGGAVAYSVKAAADFQSGMATLVTGAGELQSNLAMVSQGILNMSVATGTSTQQLTAGMYMIESAGYHGAAGLQVLQTAAEGAKVGNADLGTVSNALTTILHNYGMSASMAVPAMNALVTTVAQGKTHMQDLASSLGNVLPLASSLHIAFPQVAGALAQMTNNGMTAQRASMNLGNAIRALAAPSKTAQTAMDGVGLSATQVSNTLTHQGLQQALQMVEDAVGKKFPAGSAAWTQAMKAIMGGATGLNVALMLGGKNMAGYDANIKAITASMNGSKSSVQGWALVQGTASQKAAQAQAALQVLAITIGTKLLPVVSQILTAVTPLITKFAAWASTIQANSPVLAILGGVLAGLAVIVMAAVVPSLIAAAAGFLAVSIAGAPLWIIVLAIIAVVTAVILVFQHWGQICAWLQGVWSAFTSWLKSTWGGIGAWFQGILSNIGNFFKNTWNNIVNTAHSAGSNIQSWFSSTFNNLKNTASTGVNNLKNTMQGAWNAYVNGLQWMYNHNYYFKNAVDSLNTMMQVFSAWWSTTWKNVTTFFETTWNNITTWISSTWSHIASLATSLWNTVTSAIQTAVTIAWNWLVSIWTTATTWLASKWNSFTQLAQTAWQAVSGVFASIWTTYIAGPLASLWSSLSGWFGNLASQAVTWGKNIISGFISGIQSMLGAVGQAAQNIINTVAGFLGFHSPAKLGEGQHIIEWGQNAVKGFMQGMNNMQPQLQAQMQAMIQAPTGNTTNISRGNNTFHIHVNLQGSGNAGHDASQIATLLGNHVRAQFGNI